MPSLFCHSREAVCSYRYREASRESDTIIKEFAVDINFVADKKIGPLGSTIGLVELKDGTTIDGGRGLMRDQWNSRFWDPLSKEADSSDIHMYKNRLNGIWGGTDIEAALTSRGIKTLLFAGCNADQCVGSSLQGA
ncbi:hypothetical protein F4680DRAFT_446655 [Xylaria scruposa]|nr:hypothetical protein F4680DRAFT_446655 [Xylaria scruposa]